MLCNFLKYDEIVLIKSELLFELRLKKGNKKYFGQKTERPRCKKIKNFFVSIQKIIRYGACRRYIEGTKLRHNIVQRGWLR